MELASYLDLYLSETQESLRLLNRSLLGLESEDDGSALAEAFRAAHTIKGAAAMMGFPEVVAVAHTLEDQLDELRRGARLVDRDLIDELLAAVDLLERANEVAVTGTVQGSDALVVRVEFEASCVLKSARAAVVLRNVGRIAQLLGTVPAALDREFEGGLQLFVAAGADREALAAAARAAGEVAAVEVEEVSGADLAAAIEAAAAVLRESAPAAESKGQGAEREGTAASGSRRFLRIDAEHLSGLADGVADLGILCGRLEEVAGRLADPSLIGLVEGVRRRISELEHTTLEARTVPVGEVFHRFPRLVRDTAGSLGKKIDFRLEGQDIEADRRVLEEVAEPLMHLLRNAVDHGLEEPEERAAAGKGPRGTLVLRALRERSSIRIEIEDDGRGIAREQVVEKARALGIDAVRGPATDDELLRLLCHPGLSTAREVTGVSGRGVGLDAVVNRIRALGGAVMMRTERSRGTTFVLSLPANLMLTQGLRVRVGGEDYAMPLTHVTEVVELKEGAVALAAGEETLSLREEQIPLVRLGTVLGVAEPDRERAAVVAEAGERRVALAVDELVGREQIVVKSFVVAAGTLPIFTGATLLADGRPALVLDPVSVL
jgi:two-component system chemotaxis sensor kinase CheA